MAGGLSPEAREQAMAIAAETMEASRFRVDKAGVPQVDLKSNDNKVIYTPSL